MQLVYARLIDISHTKINLDLYFEIMGEIVFLDKRS